MKMESLKEVVLKLQEQVIMDSIWHQILSFLLSPGKAQVRSVKFMQLDLAITERFKFLLFLVNDQSLSSYNQENPTVAFNWQQDQFAIFWQGQNAEGSGYFLAIVSIQGRTEGRSNHLQYEVTNLFPK